MKAGDEAAFMATVEPGWNSHFISSQRRMFRAMQALEFDSYSLRARYEHLGDLVRPSDERHYPDASQVSIPVTEERYALAGFDGDEIIDYHYYTFVEEDGEYYIGSDNDLSSMGFSSTSRPWDFGRVRARGERGFLLIERRCPRRECARARDDLIDVAVEARERVARAWPPGWTGRVPLIVPAGNRELKGMIRGDLDPLDFVAFAVSSVDVSGGYLFSGHRIVLNPASLTVRSRSSTLHVLAHELLHVASRALAGPFTPVWVDEGLAEYVGHEADPTGFAYLQAQVAQSGVDGNLPADYEFSVGGADAILLAYQRAHLAVHFMIERHGMRKFVHFYRRLGRVRLEPGTQAYHVDRVMRDVYGFDLTEFETRWAGSIAN